MVLVLVMAIVVPYQSIVRQSIHVFSLVVDTVTTKTKLMAQVI